MRCDAKCYKMLDHAQYADVGTTIRLGEYISAWRRKEVTVGGRYMVLPWGGCGRGAPLPPS